VAGSGKYRPITAHVTVHGGCYLVKLAARHKALPAAIARSSSPSSQACCLALGRAR
jgi:hypothetical protein